MATSAPTNYTSKLLNGHTRGKKVWVKKSLKKTGGASAWSDSKEWSRWRKGKGAKVVKTRKCTN